MISTKEKILNCLKDVKGSGKFVTAHTAPFFFPGLEIEGIGELSYPINDVQASALINVAHKAPFGKGNATLLDNNVRSVWEINEDKLIFNGKQWTSFLDKVLDNIKPELGLENYAISAHLYKMLIYQKGDFFLQHKDSEKEKGMFGTLIIALPCRHEGGELVVHPEVAGPGAGAGAVSVIAFLGNVTALQRILHVREQGHERMQKNKRESN